MAFNISGDSIIIRSSLYAIEENSCYKNYIIPNSPSFSGTYFIILPMSVNKDVSSYRVINNSSNTLILQSRGIEKPEDLFNLFTIKKKFSFLHTYCMFPNNFPMTRLALYITMCS